MRLTFCLLFTVAVPVLCIAQTPHEHGPKVAGRIPAEIVERPVTLREGIGKVSHPTRATSAEAQAFYEQGLAYLHSFQFLEAARSFNQANRIETHFALAWVELSRAFTGLDKPSPDGWIEGLFILETVFNIGRATGEWELAADASMRLLAHDKAYSGSQEAARIIAARRGA